MRYYHRRYKSKNGYSPAVNVAVGSLTFFLIYFVISLFIYKICNIEKTYLTRLVIFSISFPSTKIFLRDLIHFWVY